MKSRAIWFLLSGLVILLAVPLLGCSLLPTQTPTSSLTREQVVALILASSVPYTDYYYREAVGEEDYQAAGGIGSVTPGGEWDADHDGKGTWTIQGTVTTEKWGNCLTTWTFREDNGEVKLTSFKCD